MAKSKSTFTYTQFSVDSTASSAGGGTDAGSFTRSSCSRFIWFLFSLFTKSVIFRENRCANISYPHAFIHVKSETKKPSKPEFDALVYSTVFKISLSLAISRCLSLSPSTSRSIADGRAQAVFWTSIANEWSAVPQYQFSRSSASIWCSTRSSSSICFENGSL